MKNFLKDLLMYLRERACPWTGGAEGERILSKLHVECGALRGAQAQEPETVAWAEIESDTAPLATARRPDRGASIVTRWPQRLFSSTLSPVFIHKHTLLICGFLIGKRAYLLKCICNPKTSTQSTSMVVHRQAQSEERAWPHIQVPSQGRTQRCLCVSAPDCWQVSSSRSF